MLIDRRLIAHFDWGLFISVMLIPCLGLIILYSAGYDPENRRLIFNWIPESLQVMAFIKQVAFIGVGLLVMLAAMSIPPSTLQRYAYVLYAVCFLLLVAVLGFGVVSNGSRRWLAFGGLNLQPAEPMKLALILTLAKFLSRRGISAEGRRFRDLVIPFALLLLPMALIMRQPDLGTALVVGGVGFLMILFIGIRWRSLALMAAALLAAAYPAWHTLHGYQQRRILTLINPEADPLGSGYHIIQSKIAVGSGAVMGKGFMKGTQTQLEFLPEHTTDFVFSVLAEEFGFVGCVVVIFIYFMLMYRLLAVVARSKDLFQALVVFGISAQIFMHTLINIGMVVGLFPVVGIPLPLFSYGGSSVLSTMFSIGLAMGISMRRFGFIAKS